jgi:hypothetical protein
MSSGVSRRLPIVPQDRKTPLVSIRAVQPVVAALEALGYRTEQIFARAGLSKGVLDDADGGIPHTAMMAFWQEALAATGDEHLGLHLAEAAPVEAFGVHAYALLSSPTLREAYRRAFRYQRLIHEATDLTFDEAASEGVLQPIEFWMQRTQVPIRDWSACSMTIQRAC